MVKPLLPTPSKHETRIYAKDEGWTRNQGAWLGGKSGPLSSIQLYQAPWVCSWGKGARMVPIVWTPGSYAELSTP